MSDNTLNPMERYKVNVLHNGKERFKYTRTLKRARILQQSAIDNGLSSIVWQRKKTVNTTQSKKITLMDDEPNWVTKYNGFNNGMDATDGVGGQLSPLEFSKLIEEGKIKLMKTETKEMEGEYKAFPASSTGQPPLEYVPDLLEEIVRLRSELQKVKELNGELVKAIRQPLYWESFRLQYPDITQLFESLIKKSEI